MTYWMKQGEEKRKIIRSAAILLEYVSFNKKQRDRGFYGRYRLEIYVNSLVNSKLIETFFIDNEVLILTITAFVST